jgi:hypothetical protein
MTGGLAKFGQKYPKLVGVRTGVRVLQGFLSEVCMDSDRSKGNLIDPVRS